ncbi:MAG: recombination mediator RecR [Bacteroidales bacterium]|jgi:recombination protein RecR|nr:recombination mediator RecR [Bacteroidales bacterium]
MNQQSYSSKLLENAVNEFSKLPGVGKKTALRMSLFLLKQDAESVRQFGESLIKLRNEVVYCKHCMNLSDAEECEICSNPRRDHSLICVVESVRDVMSVENTMQYQGVYHVLGGVISPMDGVGPSDLTVETLENRVREGNVSEIILALSTTMEGDTTNFYIYRRLKDFPVKISTLARGVSIGDELEYADQITLGRSIINRQPFEQFFGK